MLKNIFGKNKDTHEHALPTTYNSDGVKDTNIMLSDEYIRVVREVLNVVQEVLSGTLGPNGSNIMIQDRVKRCFLTKDGYTVLQNIRMHGDLENSVLDFLKKISTTLNRTVGDGTTTSIIIAREIFESLIQARYSILKNKTPAKFIEEFNNYVSSVIETIESKYAIKAVTDKDKYELALSIAKISTNNDTKLATMVADAYRTANYIGTVTAKQSVTQSEDTTVVTTGFNYYTNYLSKMFENNPLNNCYNVAGSIVVFASSVPLTSATCNITAFSTMVSDNVKAKRHLLIVAPGYDEYYSEFLSTNKARLDQDFTVIPVQILDPNKTEKAKEDFTDFCNFVGCLPYSGYEPNFGYEYYSVDADYTAAITKERVVLGNFDGELIVTESNTNIIGGNKGQAKVLEEILEDLKRELAEVKLTYTDDNVLNDKVYRLNKRINRLSANSSVTLYAGGNSEIERDARFYLLEDAVCAVRSALKHGYTYGMTATTIDALKDTLLASNYECYNVLLNAYLAYYYKLTGKNYDKDNLYDVVQRTFIPKKDENGKPNICNSIETETTILRTVSSIVSHVFTIEGFLSLSAIGNLNEIHNSIKKKHHGTR